MSYITIDALRKEFDVPTGVEVAVDGIDLDIEDGEFITLVGPSGCGKTTTLRCIAGLETPTDGDIRIKNKDVTETAPQDRDLAMVFQRTALYPHMTAAENIAYPLKLEGIAPDERRKSAEEVAEIVQIDELIDKYPSELSGGQQQRIAIARAIIRDPVAFLMDEPMSDLDAKLKRTMRKELGKIHKDLNATIIYVTHDQEEAMTMSDRIAVMNDGGIEQFAAPETVFREPANTFVAQFIGSPEINMLRGEMESVDEDAMLVSVDDTFTIEFSYQDFEEDKQSNDVILGFRPGKTRLVSDGGGINIDISLHEPLGDDVLTYLDGPQGELRSVGSARGRLEEGESGYLQIEEQGVFLFNADTGERFVRGDQHSEALVRFGAQSVSQ